MSAHPCCGECALGLKALLPWVILLRWETLPLESESPGCLGEPVNPHMTAFQDFAYRVQVSASQPRFCSLLYCEIYRTKPAFITLGPPNLTLNLAPTFDVISVGVESSNNQMADEEYG